MAIEQDVGRLNVAVNQTNLMTGLQGLGDLVDDAHRPSGIQRALGQRAVQVAALNKPHTHRKSTVNLPVVIDRHDMGVSNRAAAWASRRNRR